MTDPSTNRKPQAASESSFIVNGREHGVLGLDTYRREVWAFTDLSAHRSNGSSCGGGPCGGGTCGCGSCDGGTCSCGSPRRGEEPPRVDTPILDYFNNDPVLQRLARSGKWERTPVQIRVVDEIDQDPLDERDPEELAAIARADPTWHSSDGTRYEALFVSGEGVTYGRIGLAKGVALPPLLENSSRGLHGARGDSLRDQSLVPKANLLGDSDWGDDPLEAELDIEFSNEQAGQIGADCSNDSRVRYSQSSIANLSPAKIIGPLPATGSTADGGCTGAKIGPRAVLTASHCVFSVTEEGIAVVKKKGFFNPGQTNTTATFGSIPWAGAFFRDWRMGDRFDYAVLFLKDSHSTATSGYFGAAWGYDGSQYAGVRAYNKGYPCGPGKDCGQLDIQCCKESPRDDKRCDGWMYGCSRLLDASAYGLHSVLRTTHDMSKGQSGSPIYAYYDGDPYILAVHRRVDANGVAINPRFREKMWNDVCSWIGTYPSQWKVHPECQ